MKEKDNKSKIVIEIIIIILTILIALFAGFAVSRFIFLKYSPFYQFNSEEYKAYLENKNNISGTNLEYGKYFITSAQNENKEDILDSDISFDFKSENSVVYVKDLDGKYAEGTYKVENNKLVCDLTKVYENLEDVEGKATTSNFVLEIVNNKTVKILEANVDEAYGDNSNIVGNEYTYDMLENN